MKKLIIFDIDGTLINLSELEDQFYIDAVRHALGESVHISTDWLNYKYSTDSGVFFEIAHNQFSRPPSTQEIQKAQDFFVNLLAKSFLKDCTLCQCLPGASDIFEQIKCIGGDVAIATGCWKNSAELKLKKAGITFDNIPVATSDDKLDRKNIIQIAIERSKKIYKRKSYESITYIGDKPWDKNAASALGINFIGIGNGWSEFQHDVIHAKDYSCGIFLDCVRLNK